MDPNHTKLRRNNLFYKCGKNTLRALVQRKIVMIVETCEEEEEESEDDQPPDNK